MPLPEFEHVRFRRSPLKLVVGQLQVPIMLRFSEPVFIARFQEAIHRDYPKLTRGQQTTITVSRQGMDPIGNEALWHFASRDGAWSVAVTETAITLQVEGYSTRDEFFERFKAILANARDTLGIEDRTRLGLRYVNEFRFPEATTLADWRPLLTPEFVGFAAAELLDGNVEQLFHNLVVRRTDGVLAIRHGLLPERLPSQDVSVTPSTGRPYLLDLDYFDPTEGTLDTDMVIAILHDYNDVIYRFFRWTLSTRLYNYLEPIHE